MSEPVNGASERSERSEAERCGASERSERCERTNVASDRVARSKRGCLTRNAPKVNMWSAIPVALLCMIVNLSERKQGSGPEGDKVL